MRIKELLERTGKKQKDLREKLNVASSTMSQYVNGQREPGIEALIIIADFFGVSVDYLIGHNAPSGDASQVVRNFVYVNDRKYELKENALKMQINGVNVRLSLEDAD